MVEQIQSQKSVQSNFLEKMLADVRPILEKIDKVREALGNDNKIDIELPTIVVIGDQSSGKSSVLESISQVELPKGATCVTRCPIVLQLRNTRDEEYATIRTEQEKESDAQKITLDEIQHAIRDKQESVMMPGQRVLNEPINLRIYKKNYVDLTLVDLPGIYYGDDHATNLIKGMINHYIENVNSIILYVTPASSDLNTGEALSLARKVDPDSRRTLTIATKIDKREKASFAKQFEEMSSGLGVVCVRNRTQEEVEGGLSFEDLMKKEQNALSESDLNYLPKICKGTPALIEQLVQRQRDMLHSFKPLLRKKLEEEKKNKQAILREMPAAYETDNDKNQVFNKKLQEFSFTFRNVVENNSPELENKKWHLRTQIKKTLNDHSDETERLIDSMTTDEFFRELKEQIIEDQGVNLPNFLNPEILKFEIQKKIEEQQGPSNDLIEDVKEQVKIVVQLLIQNSFKEFPKLTSALQEELNEQLDKAVQLTTEEVEKMIKVEAMLVYTKSGNYTRVLKQIEAKQEENKNDAQAAQIMGSQQRSFRDSSGFGGFAPQGHQQQLIAAQAAANQEEAGEGLVSKLVSKFLGCVRKRTQEEQEFAMMQNSLYSYWGIFTNRFIDNLHNRVQFNLVFKLEQMLGEIIQRKFAPVGGEEFSEEVKAWMEEPKHQAGKRSELKSSLEKVEKCLGIINELYSTRPPAAVYSGY